MLTQGLRALVTRLAASLRALGSDLEVGNGQANARLEADLRSARTQMDTLLRSKNQLDDELTSVYFMAQKLGEATQLKQCIEIVVGMIRRFRIPYQSCVILLNQGDHLSPVHVESKYANVLAISQMCCLEEPLIGEVLENRRPRLRARLGDRAEQRIFEDEFSAICVPLIVSREILGVIYLGACREETHTTEHFRHLRMLSELAAPSIKAAKMLEDKEQDLLLEREERELVEAKNVQLACLQQLGQRIGRSLKASEALAAVAESLTEMLPFIQSVVVFTPADSHTLKGEFFLTPYSNYVRNLVLRNDEGLLGKAIGLRRTLLVQDTSLYGMDGILASENSVVLAPLLGSEGARETAEFLGLLYVGSGASHAFTEEHRSLIETVSYQTSLALKNARLYEQTQQMALTDGLTGPYSHRLFQERLAQELERAERLEQTVVLAMVDADKFKTYNDTLGHPAGDALLVEIANLLRDKIRAGDTVCRYGGDEFALLLPNTGKSEAQRVCEQIREAFLLRFAGCEVQVTSSIGLACYPVDALTKKDLAKAADDALYQSKRGGRNRVSVSRPLEARPTRPLVREVLAR